MSAARTIAIVSWLTTPTGRHRQARETAERSTRVASETTIAIFGRR
jgi:hypothetical protein